VEFNFQGLKTAFYIVIRLLDITFRNFAPSRSPPQFLQSV